MMKSYHKRPVKGSLPLALMLILSMGIPAGAISELQVYKATPAFELPSIDPAGTHVTVNSLKGKTTILIFGELYHELTLQALKELAHLRETLAKANETDGTEWRIVLIVAQDIPDEQLREEQAQKNINVTILHDRTRTVFGTYNVIVLPSVVVVDPQGNIITTISGYPLNFSDIIRDALLFSQGKITRQQYETTSHGSTAQETPLDEKQLKVERRAGLARQLFRRGYIEVAMEQFQQVLQLDEDYTPARIGMARCLVKLGELDKAETVLQAILQKDPKNLEASRIMAWIEILRGGDELDSAGKRLDMILALNRNDAEAHYLKGLIYEAKGNLKDAMAEYKQVSEILLEIEQPK